jgi:hypothetical protein
LTRRTFIERTLRQIYNGPVSDDGNITEGLVNVWLSDGIGLAAKQNYKDNYQLDGVGYVNNSFYSNFKGLAIVEDERNLYKTTLPQLPVGIGSTEGIGRVVFKNSINELSFPGVLLSENQVGYQRSMRPIPNKILCYPEGIFLYMITPLIMTAYTANVTIISGGDATNLDSELNVPADYLPVCVAYIQQQLMLEKKQIPDLANDGRDD